VALRIQRRLRDLAQIEGRDTIDLRIANEGLQRLGIDEFGLEEMDRRILQVLARHGSPLGLKTVAAAVGEAEDTVEDVFEPYLIRIGFLVRTPRGRQATRSAYRHLRISEPAEDQGRLRFGGE
jgi:Holliday junction DNA helicase RuvB